MRGCFWPLAASVKDARVSGVLIVDEETNSHLTAVPYVAAKTAEQKARFASLGGLFPRGGRAMARKRGCRCCCCRLACCCCDVSCCSCMSEPSREREEDERPFADDDIHGIRVLHNQQVIAGILSPRFMACCGCARRLSCCSGPRRSRTRWNCATSWANPSCWLLRPPDLVGYVAAGSEDGGTVSMLTCVRWVREEVALTADVALATEEPASYAECEKACSMFCLGESAACTRCTRLPFVTRPWALAVGQRAQGETNSE